MTNHSSDMDGSSGGSYSRMVPDSDHESRYIQNTQASEKAFSRYPRASQFFQQLRLFSQRFIPDSRALLRILIASAFVVAIVGIFRGTDAGEHVKAYVPGSLNVCGANVHYDCNVCSANDTGIVRLPEPEKGEWKFDWQRDGHKLGLSDEQCDAAFPGLYQDLELVARRRKGKKLTLHDMERDMRPWGALRAMIYDGQLLIIDSNNVFDPMLFERTLATLSSLHRAILATPDPKLLPNIEFTMTMHDSTQWVYEVGRNRPMWSYARKAEHDAIWLMPDFGFWSWPEGNMGTMWEISKRIDQVEKNLEFMDKKEQVFWRGAVDTAPKIRGKLVEVTKGKEWADVIPIHWDDPEQAKRNVVPITDHCKYMFLAHTEGHSYSGRLKYLQMCQSVIIAHKMEWIQPQNYMMIKSGPQQNFVEVPRDWSGLRDAIFHLVENPEEARRIADNQIKMFKERYLTQAAEACYWRKMIRMFEPFSPEVKLTRTLKGGEVVWRGMPYETFMLMKDLNYGHQFD